MDSTLLTAARNALKLCINALEDNAYDLAASEIKTAKQTLKLLNEEQPMIMEVHTLLQGREPPEHLLNSDGLCWIGQGAYNSQRAVWMLDNPRGNAIHYNHLSPLYSKNRLLHHTALPLLHYNPSRNTDGSLTSYPSL